MLFLHYLILLCINSVGFDLIKTNSYLSLGIVQFDTFINFIYRVLACIYQCLYLCFSEI